jgi:1-acyl-sn-glycerol-3-phosphate acyltransferase
MPPEAGKDGLERAERSSAGLVYQAPFVLPGWLYALVYWTCAFVMILGYGLRVVGRQRMPRRGPVLIIANHQSFFDPVLIGLAAPRRLCYLARQSLFRRRLLGYLISSLHAVPIDHEGLGLDGIRTVLGQLKEGDAVVVFPEGTRTADGRLQRFRPGIHLLLKRARVPVVPLGIAGAYEVWRRSRRWPHAACLLFPPAKKLAVVVGPAIPPDRFADLPRERMLDELFDALDGVQRQAERLRQSATA